MSRAIRVSLGKRGLDVGVLYYDTKGARESAAFEYSEGWLSNPERFAIGPELRLVRGRQFHKKTRDGSVFHDPIADTEPDGWAKTVILRDHAKHRQEAKRLGQDLPPLLTSLDFLLAVDDSTRIGALRFTDELGEFSRRRDEDRRSSPPLIELSALLSATRAVETNSETLADLEYLRGRGTSLGGLRPKCSVIDDDGRLSLAKFPSVQDRRAMTKGEVLALRLARQSGINAAEARLVESDGVQVALVSRFDRARDERIPYISAATMLGVDTTAPGTHTYTEIVDAIRANGSDAQADIEELFRRVAFSILINNVDDHLLNHGFLHVQSGQWRLAPAFDVNPFPDRERELKTWISEDSGPQASIEALLAAATHFRISLVSAKKTITDVERSVSRWREVGTSLGMSPHEMDQFSDAFEHAQRDEARRLA